MSHLRLAPYRARPFHGRPRRHRTLLDALGRAAGILGLAAGGILLLLFPPWLANQRTITQTKAWTYPYLSLVDGVERRWKAYPAPPPFARGNEPAIRRYLALWPEVEALQARKAPDSIWVRKGTNLVRMPANQDSPLCAWFAQAATQEPGSGWAPPLDAAERGTLRPMAILAGENWLVLKRWEVGSPGMERILQDLSAHPPMLRLALLPSNERPSLAAPPEAWATPTSLQIDAHGVASNRWLTEGIVTAFQESWAFFAVPTPPLERRIQAYYRLQFLWGTLFSLSAAGLAGLLWLRRNRSLRTKELEAGRLAALTHSLKTPLSVIKMRCDLLRLNPDEPDQLLELSEDVERLSGTIDMGLRLFKESRMGGTDRFKEALGPGWFEEMAAEMDTAFRGQGRELELELDAGRAWASPATLHVALQTVLENSLQHGQGPTRLRTASEGPRLLVAIQDGGPELSQTDLRRLGQFPTRSDVALGKGLGLSLLARIADDEGWGLDLSAAPEEGFKVLIQVPRVPDDVQEEVCEC